MFEEAAANQQGLTATADPGAAAATIINPGASLDPNTGLPQQPKPLTNAASALHDRQQFVDEWAKDPSAAPPVRTFVDPTSTMPRPADADGLRTYLASHPGAGDGEIASAMNSYGVSPEDFAAASGGSASEVASRYAAATGSAYDPARRDEYTAAWYDTPVNSSAAGPGQPAVSVEEVKPPQAPAADPNAPPVLSVNNPADLASVSMNGYSGAADEYWSHFQDATDANRSTTRDPDGGE